MNEAQKQKVQEIEDAVGIMVIDTDSLRAPDQKYVESADNFIRSLKERPLTREEVLGSAAAFFTDLE